uniref:Uncharacterized protein n=1 Tax=Candidatus Kentrum sp. LFY TaxID=2126342 RepID=A0A450V9V9_9GAMM|nr:MAG: hypothetical protein BECKLFY1418A_GA0070994_11511 [Candidatus Kentron sp. LFY]
MMILALSTTIIPIGCATNGSYGNQDFQNINPPEKAESRLGAAVFIYNKCPVKEGSATDMTGGLLKTKPDATRGSIPETRRPALMTPIVSAAIPLVANFAVNTIGKALDEREKGLTGEFGASGIGKGTDGNATGCLIVARGHFGPKSTKSVKNTDEGKEEGLSKALLEKLHLAAHPAFYLEAEIDKQKDNIELKPVYLSYAASSARNRGSGGKNVSLVIAMSKAAGNKNSKPEEDKPFAVFRHNLGQLKIGKFYEEEMLIGASYTQSSKDFSEETEKFNIIASVTESENPSIALEALIGAYDAKKGDIEKAITDAIKEGMGKNGK